MGGPQAAAILMRRKSTLPVRPKFAQLPEHARSMGPWEQPEVWLDSQASARALQQPASYFEIADLWDETWKGVLDQKAPLKALLDDFVRQSNSLLAREGA